MGHVNLLIDKIRFKNHVTNRMKFPIVLLSCKNKQNTQNWILQLQIFPNLVANHYKLHVVTNGIVTFWLISTSDKCYNLLGL
jgi:hypothetical protein